jgi:hypothetical protein
MSPFHPTPRHNYPSERPSTPTPCQPIPPSSSPFFFLPPLLPQRIHPTSTNSTPNSTRTTPHTPNNSTASQDYTHDALDGRTIRDCKLTMYTSTPCPPSSASASAATAAAVGSISTPAPLISRTSTETDAEGSGESHLLLLQWRWALRVVALAWGRRGVVRLLWGRRRRAGGVVALRGHGFFVLPFYLLCCFVAVG